MSRRANRQNRQRTDGQSRMVAAAQERAQIEAAREQQQLQLRAIARLEAHSAPLVAAVFAKLFDREYALAMRQAIEHAKANGEAAIDRMAVLAQVDCRSITEISRLAAREAMIALDILTEHPNSAEERQAAPEGPSRANAPQATSEAPDEPGSGETDDPGILLPDGSFSGQSPDS